MRMMVFKRNNLISKEVLMNLLPYKSFHSFSWKRMALIGHHYIYQTDILKDQAIRRTKIESIINTINESRNKSVEGCWSNFTYDKMEKLFKH